MQSTTVGIDLAKSTFQISVADRQRHIAQRRRLTRAQFERFIVHTPPARSIMEDCASAHHWGRLAQARGHQVKLLHAHYVQAYVRRNKTDASDADALVRADGDRDLEPIGVKPHHRQALQSLHRIRAQWQRARVARIFEARGSMAELAVVLPRGAQGIAQRLFDALDQLPELLAVAEWASSSARSASTGTSWRALGSNARASGGCRPPRAAPAIDRGCGPHRRQCRVGKGGRHAHLPPRTRLRLTPRELSSGSTRTLGRISRRGNT